MVSKKNMREAARAHRWRKVEKGLAERPELKDVADERGRNWLHLACMSSGEDEACTRSADVLLSAGLGLHDPDFF